MRRFLISAPLRSVCLYIQGPASFTSRQLQQTTGNGAPQILPVQVEADPGAILFFNFPDTSGDEPYGVAFFVGSDFNLGSTPKFFTFFTFTRNGCVKELQFGMSIDESGIPTPPAAVFIADYDDGDKLTGLRMEPSQSSRMQEIVEVRVVPHFFRDVSSGSALDMDNFRMYITLGRAGIGGIAAIPGFMCSGQYTEHSMPQHRGICGLREQISYVRLRERPLRSLVRNKVMVRTFTVVLRRTYYLA